MPARYSRRSDESSRNRGKRLSTHNRLPTPRIGRSGEHLPRGSEPVFHPFAPNRAISLPTQSNFFAFLGIFRRVAKTLRKYGQVQRTCLHDRLSRKKTLNYQHDRSDTFASVRNNPATLAPAKFPKRCVKEQIGVSQRLLFEAVTVVVGRSIPGGKTVDQPATNSSSVTPNPDIQQNH